ncbi:MAG: RNA pseudouridine synthase, partial [Bacillota bacterium]|nr:RNA pseudouridine synthase [Bacillota bacterium]
KNTEKNQVKIHEDGVSAKSIVRPLERSQNRQYSVVEVELVTGRTHQIRVHLASKGHPLVGDSKYGDSSSIGRAANIRVKKLGVTTQLLHAYRLNFGDIDESFDRLEGLRDLEVRAEIPEDFEKVWKELSK